VSPELPGITGILDLGHESGNNEKTLFDTLQEGVHEASRTAIAPAFDRAAYFRHDVGRTGGINVNAINNVTH
jgi:hypothetical protein